MSEPGGVQPGGVQMCAADPGGVEKKLLKKVVLFLGVFPMFSRFAPISRAIEIELRRVHIVWRS